MEGPAEIQRIRVWRSCLAATDLRIDPAGVPPSLTDHSHAQEHIAMLLGWEINYYPWRRGSGGSG